MSTKDPREHLPFSVKPISRPELEKAVDVWVLSFGDLRRAFWRDYAENELDSVLGAYIGEELGAVVGMHDFEVRAFGKWIPCLGIAAVASTPTRRGQGLVKALLTECLKSAHRRKIPLSMLGASKPSIYESMGWAVSDWHYQIELNLDYFEHLSNFGSAKNYTIVPGNRHEKAAALREQWLSNGNLGIRRSEKRWQRMASIFGPDFVWQTLVHEDGYMILDLGRSQQKGRLVVAEWVYLSDNAFKDGLALFANMRNQYSSVEWLDSTPERLLKLGLIDQTNVIRLSTGHLSRVVNLEAFEKALNVNLSKVSMRDPLAVMCQNNDKGLTPGQLVQLVTGFWSDHPEGWPKVQIPDAPISFTTERF
ncbi:MAG TPA: GNAT family N-acetyltransferase [Drouetiella sp.]